MSMLIATIISTLFHAIAITAFAVWVGNYFPISYIQKGSGSIEVELVVPGWEGVEKGRKSFFSSPVMEFQESVRKERVREDFDWQLQGQKRRIPSIAVRMPLDPGALTETLGDFRNPPPRYPRVAIIRGWEGETVVRISVDLSGVVKDAKVIRPSGHSILDRAVLEVLPKWRLENVRNRQLEIPFKFVLNRREGFERG